uniref:WH2 domain-containing protein n=1 Tax=Clastoptera arizonana TaxID=38151 RepID=A0A1B6EEV9_9HEMI
MSAEQVPWRRQSNQISSGGGSPGPGSPQGDTGLAAPPPPPLPTSGPPAPPPPPPPGLGALPTVRLSSEIPDRKKGGYEPPAAIQNAMMTKDKKPFTYTPGGLDLSEIRSPRMARRITRNANAPDSSVPQPRPSPLANQPLPPSAMAAMQPQIAIPVFPQGGGVPQLHHVGAPGSQQAPPPPPPPSSQNFPAPQTSPPVQKFQATPPPPPPVQKFSPPTYNQPSYPTNQKSPPATYKQPSPPPMSVPKSQPQNRYQKPEQNQGSIYVPPIESQQPRSQLGSLYIPPIPQDDNKAAIQSPVQLNKAPTPWLTRSQSQKEKEVPPWVNREENVPSQPSSQAQQQTRIIPIQIEGKEQTMTPTNTRIIPIQMEGANSPVYNKEPNFQQSPAPSPQQHWQQQQSAQQQWQQQQQQQQSPQPQQQQRWKNQQPVYVHNKFNTGSQSPVLSNDQTDSNRQLQTQQSWGQTGQTATNGVAPVQSRSFRVLQKITDTADGTQSGGDLNDASYNSQGVPVSQLRKMQLSDDDRALLNKVKTQVDEENFLHNESDPRYRGSSIPSRAFRMLQTMTGEGEEIEVPRMATPNQSGQNRLVQGQQQPELQQPYIPPSEQQVPEPRKYTGSAIPSRSFRMLQAMTAGSDTSDRPGESEY